MGGRGEIFKNGLYDLRMKKNLSCLKVAIEIGTSENAIARLERGQQKLLLEQAGELAKVFGVTLGIILSAMHKQSVLYEEMKSNKKK